MVQDKNSPKRFDICEIERRMDEIEHEEAIPSPEDPLEKLFQFADDKFKYRVLTFKHFTGVARKAAEANDPSLLEAEYNRLLGELGDRADEGYADILRSCYETGIGWYKSDLKWKAFVKQHVWMERGKEEDYQVEETNLKNELMENGFAVFNGKEKCGDIVNEFIRNATYSLYKNAGFQKNMSFSGRVMSADQIRYFQKKYSSIM